MDEDLLLDYDLAAIANVDADRKTDQAVGDLLTTEVIDRLLFLLLDSKAVQVGSIIIAFEEQAIGRGTQRRGLPEIALEARQDGLRPRVETYRLLALSRLQSKDRTARTNVGGDLRCTMTLDVGSGSRPRLIVAVTDVAVVSCARNTHQDDRRACRDDRQ